MDLHVSLLQREHHEILAEIAIWQILAYIVFFIKICFKQTLLFTHSHSFHFSFNKITDKLLLHEDKRAEIDFSKPNGVFGIGQ